jgi:hypothetical protein
MSPVELEEDTEDFFQNALEGLFIDPEVEPAGTMPAPVLEPEAEGFFF